MTSFSERSNILNEIIDTEKNYNDQLELVDLIYAKGLRDTFNSKSPLIDSNSYKLIFEDLDIIRKVNQGLFESLLKNREEEKNHKKPTKTIGEIFLEFAPVLKTYTNYCQNFDKVTKKIEELKKKSAFDDYLYNQKCLNENTTNFTLESYLILPIQRIPRYELLLKDLLKHTSKYHRDYEFLTKSVSEMKSVATFVNTNIIEFQSFEKLKELIKDVKELPKDFDFISTSRKLDKEFQIKYKEFEEESEITLYLMNDLILLVKKKGKQNIYFKHLLLNSNPFLWILEKENEIIEIISKDEIWNICFLKDKLLFLKSILSFLDEIIKKNPEIIKQRANYFIKEKKQKNTSSIKDKILTKIFNIEESSLYPKKRDKLIIEKQFDSFQISDYSKCLGIGYSIIDYPNLNNKMEDEIKYKQGDIFLILEKNIKNSNIQWCFVCKVGMSFSKFEYSYDLLCNLMKEKGKDKIISNLYKDLNLKPPQKKDILNLISLPELPKMEMSFEKLENFFEEKGQLGVVPMKCIKEIIPLETENFIKKFQERDENEEKKLRNFKVNKKKDSIDLTTAVKIIPEKRKSVFDKFK